MICPRCGNEWDASRSPCTRCGLIIRMPGKSEWVATPLPKSPSSPYQSPSGPLSSPQNGSGPSGSLNPSQNASGPSGPYQSRGTSQFGSQTSLGQGRNSSSGPLSTRGSAPMTNVPPTPSPGTRSLVRPVPLIFRFPLRLPQCLGVLLSPHQQERHLRIQR